MSRYHAKEGQCYLSTTAAGAAVAVSGATSWTFDGSVDKVDVTAFGDANKQQVIGLSNASGAINFNWDDTDTTIYDAAEGGEACRMYLYRDAANAPTHYRYGAAYIDIADDNNSTGAATGSATFSAAGAWSRKP
jgi:hypothetical protein